MLTAISADKACRPSDLGHWFGMRGREAVDLSMWSQEEQEVAAESPNRDDLETDAIKRARAGDLSGFEYLLRRHEDSIYSFLVRWLRDRSAAKDVYQDAMLCAFRSLHTLRGRTSFRAWLFSIAVSRAKDYVRREQRERRRRDACSDSWTERQGSSQESRLHASALVAGALSQLRERDRMLVLLRFSEELSIPEIARATGISPLVANMRVHRARQRFQRAVTLLEKEKKA